MEEPRARVARVACARVVRARLAHIRAAGARLARRGGGRARGEHRQQQGERQGAPPEISVSLHHGSIYTL